MIPLTADLAPAHRRSSAIAITISGLMLGLLIARVLSGTITRFSSWRNVYWMSVGLQYGESLVREAALRPGRPLIGPPYSQ